jgi:hypothetical protein
MYCIECLESVEIAKIINENNYLIPLFFCRFCEKEYDSILTSSEQTRLKKIKKIID